MIADQGIAVVEARTGAVLRRPGDTLTIDVPVNLPPECDVEVADGFRGSYLSNQGSRIQFPVRTRPLSWRAPGERCLVARSGGLRQMRRYRLCSVSAP
jgi:hypothetical protein